jgi:hypothetical protein
MKMVEEMGQKMMNIMTGRRYTKRRFCPSSAYFYALKMAAESSSETLTTIYKTAWSHIREITVMPVRTSSEPWTRKREMLDNFSNGRGNKWPIEFRTGLVTTKLGRWVGGRSRTM